MYSAKSRTSAQRPIAPIYTVRSSWRIRRSAYQKILTESNETSGVWCHNDIRNTGNFVSVRYRECRDAQAVAYSWNRDAKTRKHRNNLYCRNKRRKQSSVDSPLKVKKNIVALLRTFYSKNKREILEMRIHLFQ